MTRPFDPAGRTVPRLLKPPGSIPALGHDRPVAAPPPLSYAPMGPVAAGDPGKGPGFALADHRHPPQVIPPGTTAATAHRATWTHSFGGVALDGTLNPGSSFTIGNGAAGGAVITVDNPSGELHADGTYHVAVHGVYLVNVTATVALQGNLHASDYGVADFQISGPTGVEAAAVRHIADAPAPLDLPMSIGFSVPFAAGAVFSFLFTNMADSAIPLHPADPGLGDLGNGVQAEVSVYLLGTL